MKLHLSIYIKEYSLIEYQLFYTTQALQIFPVNKKSKKLQNQFKATFTMSRTVGLCPYFPNSESP